MATRDNPPFRSYIMNCVREDADLPAAYRWLYKYHVPDSLAHPPRRRGLRRL